MAGAQWWLIDIVLPAILLIALIWLVMSRSNRSSDQTEAGTRDLYRDEEQRRRDGTDQL